MHTYHKQAEKLVKEIISDLSGLLPMDGEDISYYNPGYVDGSIFNLIRVRTLLACANVIVGKGKNDVFDASKKRNIG